MERDPAGRQLNVSRMPVVVVVGGLALAISLVVLGAWLVQQPAPRPDLSRPGTADAPRDVNVIMRDYAFDPSPLYLVAGETVRLHIFNGGLVEHELVLGDQGVQAAWEQADDAAASAAAAASPELSPPPASVAPGTGGLRIVLGSGAETTIVYQVPAAGTLQLYCHLPGHAEKGMVGQVIVVSR